MTFSLWLSDGLFFIFLVALMLYAVKVFRDKRLLSIWKTIMAKNRVTVSCLLLVVFLLIAVLDSIHFVSSDQQSLSLLDGLLTPMHTQVEKTYSRPFAIMSFSKTSKLSDSGRVKQYYKRLQINHDLTPKQANQQILNGILIALSIVALLPIIYSLLRRFLPTMSRTYHLSLVASSLALLCCIVLIAYWMPIFHILGTDKVGTDVLYMALKSIRTGLLIGLLTTFVMLPLAIFLGLLAGSCRGWIDDLIQYIYTTISSVPGVLLIAAGMLSVEMVLENHGHLFSSQTQRADLQLVVLCCILGIASWAGLCRLLRAESLKVIQMDYVKASRALGASTFWILRQHIFRNVAYVILITIALDFSGLVLAEAVLSYIGLGVHAMTYSWGNMINMARLELARDPVIWWPLISAFCFMFTLVLSANILADAIRDGFDPR